MASSVAECHQAKRKRLACQWRPRKGARKPSPSQEKPKAEASPYWIEAEGSMMALEEKGS